MTQLWIKSIYENPNEIRTTIRRLEKKEMLKLDITDIKMFDFLKKIIWVFIWFLIWYNQHSLKCRVIFFLLISWMKLDVLQAEKKYEYINHF